MNGVPMSSPRKASSLAIAGYPSLLFYCRHAAPIPHFVRPIVKLYVLEPRVSKFVTMA
jgi:hypothetical protein